MGGKPERRWMRAESALTGRGRQILQHHAVAEHERVDVQPQPALFSVERKNGLLALLSAERIEEMARSVGDRRRAHTGRPEGNSPGRTVPSEVRPCSGCWTAPARSPTSASSGGGSSTLLRAEKEGNWPTPKSVQCSMASPPFTAMRPACRHPNMAAACDDYHTNPEATSSPGPLPHGLGQAKPTAQSRSYRQFPDPGRSPLPAARCRYPPRHNAGGLPGHDAGGRTSDGSQKTTSREA